MAQTTEILTAKIRVPNFFFTVDGVSYTGDYRIVRGQGTVHVLTVPSEDLNPKSLYFRNTLLANYEIKLSESEVLSKKFQNSKEKIEKIIKFTHSK